MRYFFSEGIERIESEQLFSEYNKQYSPFGDVTLDRGVLLDAPGIQMENTASGPLVLEPDTASWLFLSETENSFLKSLSSGRDFGWIQDQWPKDAQGHADDFIVSLFRRGIVRINGQKSLDQDLFRDSPHVSEGKLVELLLSEKCNLACGYCLAGANPNMPHMTDEIAKKAIDLAYKMDSEYGFTFEFSGGEPFLRFDLMQSLTEYIFEHSDRKGRDVYLCVQTNGTLLNKKRVQWLADNNVIVGLSIDGNPDSHNMSRPQVNGKESFSKVQHGMDLMSDASVDFGLLVVLNRSNIASVESLVDFLGRYNIQRLKLNPVSFLGTGRSGWDAFGLDQTEIINYFQTLLKLIIENDYEIYEANLFDMIRHIISKQRHSRCLRGHCGAGDSFNTIAADGNIFPCGRATQSPGLILGNVMTEQNALNEPGKRNLFVQQIRERRPKTLEGCVSCSYREMCQSGCSAQAYEKYGTVRHRTPECDYFKTMYPMLMRLFSFDEKAIAYLNRSPYFSADQRLVINRQDYLH